MVFGQLQIASKPRFESSLAAVRRIVKARPTSQTHFILTAKYLTN